MIFELLLALCVKNINCSQRIKKIISNLNLDNRPVFSITFKITTIPFFLCEMFRQMTEVTFFAQLSIVQTNFSAFAAAPMKRKFLRFCGVAPERVADLYCIGR